MTDNEFHANRMTDDADDNTTGRLVQADIHADREIESDKPLVTSVDSKDERVEDVEKMSTTDEAAGGKVSEANSKAGSSRGPADDDVQHMVEFDRTGVDGTRGRCSTASVMDTLAQGFTAGVVIILLLTICVLLASSLMYFENKRGHTTVARTNNETDGIDDIGTFQIVLFLIAGVVDVIVLVACTSYLLMSLYCVSYGTAFVKFSRVSMPISSLFYAFIGCYAIYWAAIGLSDADKRKRNAYFYQVVLGTAVICVVEAFDMLLVGISACIKLNQIGQCGYEPIEDSEQPRQQETGASTVEAVGSVRSDKATALGASTDSKTSPSDASLTSSGRYQHRELRHE